MASFKHIFLAIHKDMGGHISSSSPLMVRGLFYFQSASSPWLWLNICYSWGQKAKMTRYFNGGVARFRSYSPPKQDYYTVIATLDNIHGTGTATYTYQVAVGVQKSIGRQISKSVFSEIGIEILDAFKFGMKYTSTWQSLSYSSSTYSSMITHIVSIKVPVGQKVIVKQLTGWYGHYIVHAQHFKLVRKSSTKVHVVTYTSKVQL